MKLRKEYLNWVTCNQWRRNGVIQSGYFFRIWDTSSLFSRNWIWCISALKSDIWLQQIYIFSWESNNQILCRISKFLRRIWKHVNSTKHWIAIASKTATWQYGSSIQFYSRWKFSQISSVSFLVYTLLCMGSWDTDSWSVVRTLGECYWA